MFKVIPIGGIGEIGMNMVVLDSDGESIVIDCGVLFPPFQNLGVDTIVADYEDFCRRFKNIKALFITHGHEDHVGGIPYLIKHCDPKIYATAYAAQVIRARCRSVLGSDPKLNIKTVKFGDKIKEGSFLVEYIEVDHSIPDSSALFIKTPESNILYVADFRLYGRNKQAFLDKIGAIKSKDKIDILLSDSTNAQDEGSSISEEDVLKGLDSYFRKAEKKIIVTLFSSNISRINQVISLCKKYGKKLFISGNNLKIHMNIARSLGYLEPDNGCIRPDKEISKTNEEETVFICTGSQAEKNSSIVKLSHGVHQSFDVNEGDLVIFSSSQIPGNEKMIMSAINRLSEMGADIVYSDDYGVHCSGHANRRELKELLSNIRPKIFVPMHGEHIHMKHHVALAVEEGVPEKNCFILKKGDELLYDGEQAKVRNVHKFRRFYVDSLTGELIDDVVIKEREIASEYGLVIATLAVDEKGTLRSSPSLLTYGMSRSPGLADLVERAEAKVEQFCAKRPKGDHIAKDIQEIRNIVRREFRREYDNKPEVVINFIEVSLR